MSASCPQPSVSGDAAVLDGPSPTAVRDEAPAARWTLDEVYRAHAPQVARWATHLGGPRVDVEDAVHEVFLVVRRRLPEFRGDAKVTTWLYRITTKVVADLRRKEKLRAWLRSSRRDDVEAGLTSAASTPSEALEREQSRTRVHAVLDRLPEKYRTVIVLFELEGMSGDEVAALTGTKLATLWVHLHRARALFVAELKRLEGRNA